MKMHPANQSLLQKYNYTAWFYDVLDFPSELTYRRWRPKVLQDVAGNVLEVGVGTGRNLPYYSAHVQLTGIDLNPNMLKLAHWRARNARCQIIELKHEDAAVMSTLPSNQYDWLISTFMCCVMPVELQSLAIAQFKRVLKPGGRFRIVEIVYSKQPFIRWRQKILAGFAAKVYGAHFDRDILKLLTADSDLQIDKVSYLHADTHLLIEGSRRSRICF